ncbi:MAG: GNAT family N-acetyltransferase, partial [Phyllobacterium sp.]
MIIVRAIAESDANSWRRLWAGYVAFYETSLTDEITDHTCRRMYDPSAPVIGRVAERDGNVAGFSMSVLHEGTWTLAPICYLEDLF